MPKNITENGQLYILYDNCEEYIYLGPDPQYENDHKGPLFIDIELQACCQGEILDKVPITPTPTISLTPSLTATNTPTPTVSISQSPTPTLSATPTCTPTVSVTPSYTATPSNSPSITPTQTATPTTTSTNTPTISVTPSITISNTPTISITPTISASQSPTPTITPTITVTPSITASPTPTPTPSATEPFINPSVTNIFLYDTNSNPYELYSIDYAPSSTINNTNSRILAVAIPLNNYSHNFLTSESALSTSYDKSGNMLFASDTYLSSFIYKKKEIDIYSNSKLWNNTKYPASRSSSVHYNSDLNRWFIGCRCAYNSPTLFLYGYNNGDVSQFFVGGNSMLAVNDTNTIVDGLLCGPTKIYSIGNKVFLANKDFVYTLCTTDMTGDANGALDYTFKQFGHKCIDSSNCGLYDNISDTIRSFYQALPSIIQNNLQSESIEIIYPSSPYVSTSVDSEIYQCPTTSFYHGYSLSSQDFGVDVSTGIIFNGKNIVLSFSAPINVIDATLMQGKVPVSKNLYSFSGSADLYTLETADDNLLNRILQEKNNPYYLRIITDNPSIHIPETIFIPLYNADIGFSINNSTFFSNKTTNIATPICVINPVSSTGQDYFTQYMVKADSVCESGFEYIVQNSETITPALSTLPYVSFCIADLPGSTPTASIKCILSHNEFIYTFVQLDPEPESIPDADRPYFYNLYRSHLSTPGEFTLILNNIWARRQFREISQKPYDLWQESCMIDDNFIIIGVRNSNQIIKIPLEVASSANGINPAPVSIDKQNINNICLPDDNDDVFSNFAALNCAPCSFDETNAITGLCSGASINGFNITYNGLEHNKHNGSYYFICSIGDTTSVGSNAISDFILGEPVDLIAFDPSFSIDNLTICYKSDSKNYMILQGSNTGLSYLPGYGCSTISNIKELSNDDFIP